MKIHLLSGFLGSGKTTAVHQAASVLLQRNKRIGIITNDQGSRLVDGAFFKHLDLPGRQVINGCFCCNYHQLDAGIQSLIEMNDTEIIFAESVGSCTDIVATVLKPLLLFRPGAFVTLSTFADVRLLQMILNGQHSFDETVEYIYLKQLEEAAIIVVNKIDLIPGEDLLKIKLLLNKKYGDKKVLYQNSLNKENIVQWLSVLNEETTAPTFTSLDIDYNIYANGEAFLTWLDQVIEIYSNTNNSMQHAENLINTIYKKINAKQYPIGHLKFLINDSIKISFTSANESGAVLPVHPASSISILINIRIQTTPDAIKKVLANAFEEVEMQNGCKIIVNSFNAFQPGYPKPAYRM